MRTTAALFIIGLVYGTYAQNFGVALYTWSGLNCNGTLLTARARPLSTCVTIGNRGTDANGNAISVITASALFLTNSSAVTSQSWTASGCVGNSYQEVLYAELDICTPDVNSTTSSKYIASTDWSYKPGSNDLVSQTYPEYHCKGIVIESFVQYGAGCNANTLQQCNYFNYEGTTTAGLSVVCGNSPDYKGFPSSASATSSAVMLLSAILFMLI